MTMKCEEVEQKMVDYLDGNLDTGSRQEIDKHLETCERCLDELSESQQILNLIPKGEMEKPDDSLRINFYHMLHSEMRKSEKRSRISEYEPALPWYSNNWYRVAAAIALLISGTFIGLLLHTGFSNSYTSNELKQLQTEVSELKETAMFTMLKEESSSDRIQAVRYVEDLDNPDQNVIGVLIKTLNRDKNVNVRMAAAYALSRFADRACCMRLACQVAISSERSDITGNSYKHSCGEKGKKCFETYSGDYRKQEDFKRGQGCGRK